ncbi:hypothetical protein B0H16DRAFT_1329183, partial [Mycena metata]
TFYAHDRHLLRWVHELETSTIKPKGEGVSQMIGDFVSDVYGWLKSKKPNTQGYVQPLILHVAHLTFYSSVNINAPVPC